MQAEEEQILVSPELLRERGIVLNASQLKRLMGPKHKKKERSEAQIAHTKKVVEANKARFAAMRAEKEAALAERKRQEEAVAIPIRVKPHKKNKSKAGSTVKQPPPSITEEEENEEEEEEEEPSRIQAVKKASKKAKELLEEVEQIDQKMDLLRKMPVNRYAHLLGF